MEVQCPHCQAEIEIQLDPLSGKPPGSFLCASCDGIVHPPRQEEKKKKKDNIRPFRIVDDPNAPSVLIIEDSKTVAAMLKDTLENSGFRVMLAEDGEVGLALIHDKSPDVVLLDLKLPKMSGFDVLKEAKASEDSKNIPILVMSAVYRDPSNIRIARDLGAKGFLNKDSIADTVVERLQTCTAA